MVIEINLLTMQTTQGRLKSYIEDTLQLSVRKFEDSIGVSNGTVGSYLKKEKDSLPSNELYHAIIDKYPSIDRVWWLTGLRLTEATSETGLEDKTGKKLEAWKKLYLELLDKVVGKGIDID